MRVPLNREYTFHRIGIRLYSDSRSWTRREFTSETHKTKSTIMCMHKYIYKDICVNISCNSFSFCFTTMNFSLNISRIIVLKRLYTLCINIHVNEKNILNFTEFSFVRTVSFLNTLLFEFFFNFYHMNRTLYIYNTYPTKTKIKFMNSFYV